MTGELPYFWIVARVNGSWRQRTGYLTADFADRVARDNLELGHYEAYRIEYGERLAVRARVRRMNEEAA